jgi:hypothetical protein
LQSAPNGWSYSTAFSKGERPAISRFNNPLGLN